MRCKTCDGTGKIFCLQSGYVTDGYRRERCGICAGSGESAFQPEAGYFRFQKSARERVGEWGAMAPPEHIARQLAPGLFR